jgi:hypothetical protein
MDLLAARDREDQLVRQALQASLEEEQISKAINASIELAVRGSTSETVVPPAAAAMSGGHRSPGLRVYVDATAASVSPGGLDGRGVNLVGTIPGDGAAVGGDGVGGVRSSSRIYRTDEERIQEALRRSVTEH